MIWMDLCLIWSSAALGVLLENYSLDVANGGAFLRMYEFGRISEC